MKPTQLFTLLLLPFVFLSSSGCSIKKMAVNSLGKALAQGGGSYARDDDPELVAGAIPFGLKTIESLLESSPENPDLLLAATSGFTQYGYAFVQLEADYVEAKDFDRATAMRARAARLYRRALGYGLRGLEARHPGFEKKLRSDPASALGPMVTGDVPILYWTAASWGAAISIQKEDSNLVADQGLAEALVRRGLELDERFGGGSLHDFLISLEGGRPAAGGGSAERAKKHFQRAVELSNGHRAAPYLSYAESVLVTAQNRAEFESVLEKALEVDVNKVPDYRLANLIAQKRARWLLTRLDHLFLE
jgi:tetratricopeptide (TPR) repeat protein